MTKILLVEDDKSLREIYGVRLLAEGYDIVSAGDGEEALAMAIKEKPTLIISDVMMPKISGFDMLDILRSTTETRDIKVIMMTALSSDDQRSRGEQLGADRYLVKSQVGIEDVIRTVHEVLADAPAGAAAAAATATAATTAAEPTDEPETPAPADEPATEEPSTPVVPEPAAPSEPVAPSSDEAELASVEEGTAQPPLSTPAPGNEEAGPLPPQPTESTLPQPTAPFSSPRPANLGENIIQPLTSPEPAAAAPDIAPVDETATVSAETLAQELQASAEPVANTQVDEAISDAEVAPEAPAVPPLPDLGTADPGLTPLAAPAVDPLSENKEETPAVSPLTPPPASPSSPQPPTTPPAV